MNKIDAYWIRKSTSNRQHAITCQKKATMWCMKNSKLVLFQVAVVFIGRQDHSI